MPYQRQLIRAEIEVRLGIEAFWFVFSHRSSFAFPDLADSPGGIWS